MIYIVGTVQNTGYLPLYILFETNSNSFFDGDKNMLRRLAKRHKLMLGNNALEGIKETETTVWYQQTRHIELDKDSGASYTLICKQHDGKYKLAGCDSQLTYVNTETLKTYIQKNQIANCQIIAGKYEQMGCYTIDRNIKFEKYIAEKYAEYTAKSAVIGRKMSFDYTIENDTVRLTKYTGITTELVAIPSFITAIGEKAFKDRPIEEVLLNKELKYIGSHAFRSCDLMEIAVHDNVEFIGKGAFSINPRFEKRKNGLRYAELKILEAGTTLIKNNDNYIYTR